MAMIIINKAKNQQNLLTVEKSSTIKTISLFNHVLIKTTIILEIHIHYQVHSNLKEINSTNNSNKLTLFSHKLDLVTLHYFFIVENSQISTIFEYFFSIL